VSVLTKIFENVVLSMIAGYWETNNLFSSTQYGFRARHSTSDACADLVEKVCTMIDNGMVPGAIFLDAANAFPTVNHAILLENLWYYGFSQSWLSG
jgi:retron-type reverse transcriptase